MDKGGTANYCKLVWEGTVLQANFPEFRGRYECITHQVTNSSLEEG